MPAFVWLMFLLVSEPVSVTDTCRIVPVSVGTRSASSRTSPCASARLRMLGPTPRPAPSGTTYNFYVGNLHSHTSYSDGVGTPADAFGYARDSAGIDFLAVTDHHCGLTDAEYADILAQADAFTENGVFVGIGGQEWTGIGRSHATVYEAGHVFTAPADDFDSFYVEVFRSGCTAIFSHPEPANFDGYAYSDSADVAINAVEVRYEHEHAMFAKILNKGWRVGVDGSQDNHCWDWGDLPRWTIALAPDLTRADILDATRNHRTCSTRDRGIRLSFLAEGRWMGETFAHAGNISFSVTVSDSGINDKFGLIELYQNGLPIVWMEVDSSWATWSPEITPPTGVNSYFVKACQFDNDKAWSSPIWIECTSALPSTPVLSNPEDGAVGCGLFPKLAWYPSDSTETYTLEYSAADSFPEGPATVTLAGIVDTCYTISHRLGDGRWYYWRVTASNDSGSSIVSGTRCFFTDVGMFGGGSEIRLTTDPAADTRPAVCQTATQVWLAWSSRRDGHNQLYFKTSPDGETWSDATRLTDHAGSDLSPAILENMDGDIWIVWHSTRIGDSEIYYKSYDGVSWSPDARLTQHPGADEGASIAQDVDSLVWVAWASDRLEGNYEIYCSTFNGEIWSSETRLTHNCSLDHYPRITRADNGDLWMVWSTDRYGEPELCYKIYNGSSWSESIRLGSAGESPSITRTGDGQVWVAYVRDSDVFYRLHEAGDWSDESELPTGPAASHRSSVTRDSSGRICVAFSSMRQANEDIYVQRTRCSVTSGVEPEERDEVGLDSVLLRNYPNPFGVETAVEFELPSPGRVELVIYDVRGEELVTLVDGWKSAGPHSVRWDGRSEAGVEVPSGLYFGRLRFRNSCVKSKLVYLR